MIVPTTLVGLLVFLVLLVPGFAYTLRRERVASSRDVSVFGETIELAFVSVTADAVVLGLFALLRTILPSWTPDVRQLLREPGRYGHKDDQDRDLTLTGPISYRAPGETKSEVCPTSAPRRSAPGGSLCSR